MLPGAWTESNPTKNRGQSANSQSRPTTETAEDWINQRRVNGWLTQEDKERCLEEGRCFRCLKMRHKSVDCPFKRDRVCASCRQTGHRSRDCPLENNQVTTQWCEGTKEVRQAPALPPRNSRPDIGALPMNELIRRIQGAAQTGYPKTRCANCQQTKCSLKDCPITSLVPATMSRTTERQTKENLAGIIRNLKAMSMEDRVGMLAKLFEEESIPEPQEGPGIIPNYDGINQSLNIWKPARIRLVNTKPMRVMTKGQVKKDLLRYNLEERTKIVLATLKGVQVGPQSPATIAKWRKEMAENPGKLHPEVLKAVAIQLRAKKWQQRLKKQPPTPAKMGGITMLVAGDTNGPKNRRTPVIVNQLSTKETRLQNKGSPAKLSPQDQPRQTIAQIRAISTGNPERGRRITQGYLELVHKVQKDVEKDDHPDHIHTTRTEEQLERTSLQKQVAKDLKRQTKSVPGLGQKLVEQYKLKQQQRGIEQGHIPTEPIKPFRTNSPLNMVMEDYPPDMEIKDRLYTNLPVTTNPEALYVPMYVRLKLGTQVIPALLDTGATRNVLSQAAATKMGLNWITEETPAQVTNVDGSHCGSGIINQYCDIPVKLDDLWKTERFYLAETGTDQAILGMPWLENFNPTVNWTEGTIKEVLEVPLHLQKNKGGKKCIWKEGLLEEPTIIKTPQCKENADSMLITKLQGKKLKSKEGLEQELPNDYLEDLLGVEETPDQDPQGEIASRRLEANEQSPPWFGDHCPKQGIRPSGEQDQDKARMDPVELATTSPTKGESDDQWELRKQSQIIKPEPDRNNNLEADKQKPPISHQGTDPMRLEMYKVLGIVEVPQRPVLRAKDPKVRRARVCKTVAGLVLQVTQVTNAAPWLR